MIPHYQAHSISNDCVPKPVFCISSMFSPCLVGHFGDSPRQCGTQSNVGRLFGSRIEARAAEPGSRRRVRGRKEASGVSRKMLAVDLMNSRFGWINARGCCKSSADFHSVLPPSIEECLEGFSRIWIPAVVVVCLASPGTQLQPQPRSRSCRPHAKLGQQSDALF